MKIQPIPYGVNRNAVSVLLEWDGKAFFSDVVKLKANLLDEDNNLIEALCKEMTIAEYNAFGETKEEKAIAILAYMGYEYVDVAI